MAYESSFSGAQADAALTKAAAISAFGATLTTAADVAAALTALGMTQDQVDALSEANAPSQSNPVATLDDMEGFASGASEVFVPVLADGVLTLDLQGLRDSYHALALDETVTSVVVTGAPTSGPVRAHLRLTQATPSGTTYGVDLTAWVDVATTVRWTTDYYIWQDATPTDIELLSLDGWGSVDLAGNPPREPPVLEIGTSTTLAWATHGRKRLKCTAAVTLTVDASTDLDDGEWIEIDPYGGDVTIAESSATVKSVGNKRTITQDGGAILTGRGSDIYTLVGTLE